MSAGPDTVAVLALDAADVRLARRWECSNLLLEEHQRLETFSHSLSFPRTVEVWPTVATGVHPETHGVSGDGNEWEHPVLRAVSSITRVLPRSIRATLGRPVQRAGHRRTIATTDYASIFDNGVVRYWPGLVEASHLVEAWRLLSFTTAGELTETELERRLKGMTGEEFGWLAVATDWPIPIAGIHSHILDTSGHVYADRESKLRAIYEWVDSELAHLRRRVDRLVVLSDHGMGVGFLDDDEPGKHTGDAIVAVQGFDDPLPETVFDVRDWLAEHLDSPVEGDDETQAVSDTTEERLQDLGYVQ